MYRAPKDSERGLETKMIFFRSGADSDPSSMRPTILKPIRMLLSGVQHCCTIFDLQATQSTTAFCHFRLLRFKPSRFASRFSTRFERSRLSSFQRQIELLIAFQGHGEVVIKGRDRHTKHFNLSCFKTSVKSKQGVGKMKGSSRSAQRQPYVHA
jgi:hypothetical protein